MSKTLTAAAALAALLLAAPSLAQDAEAAAPAEAEAPAADAAPTAEIPAGDATKGATVFRQCMACHVIVAGQNRVGPSLHGIIGRTAGSIEGFRYSDANKNSGVVWTKENLFVYLENPREFIPGTTMAFAGLRKPEDRANVIAYIEQESAK